MSAIEFISTQSSNFKKSTRISCSESKIIDLAMVMLRYAPPYKNADAFLRIVLIDNTVNV